MVWVLKDEHGPISGIEYLRLTHPSLPHYIKFGHEEGEIIGRHCFQSPCSCTECLQQFRGKNQTNRTLQYSVAFSDSEARALSSKLTKGIIANHNYLLEQCSKNGNAILKRWKGKSKEERRALILDVDPDIYQHQWCDQRTSEAFTKTYEKEMRSQVKPSDSNIEPGLDRRPYEQTFLLPYFNLEVLISDPLKLLSLLHNRTKYAPQQWAAYDDMVIRKDWEIGTFSTIWNGGCIVMQGEEYGKWVEYKMEAAHRWDIVGFPRAILVLKAQNRLMDKLHVIIKKLLEGLERDDVVCQNARFLKVVEAGSKTTTREDLAAGQFESVYLNQPFCAPPSFNIKDLLSIAKSRLDLHADHIWLLQTDPAYTRRHASAMLAGAAEDILTKPGIYKYVALGMMDDCLAFWSWQWIKEEVENLQTTHAKYVDGIHCGQALPRAYEEALGCLEALLLDQVHRRLILIRTMIPLRPGFKNCWTVMCSQQSRQVLMHAARKTRKELLPCIFSKDRLDFCLLALVEGPIMHDKENKTTRHSPADIFAILDEHLTTCAKKGNKEELARLDEILYTMLSDFSAVHQMLAIVQLHRPHGRTIQLDEARKLRDGGFWRYREKHFLDQNRWQPMKVENDELKYKHKLHKLEDESAVAAAQIRLGDLFADFWNTEKPSGIRTTQAWLDQAGKQRAALMAFWQGIRDRHRETLLRLEFSEEDITRDLITLSADSNPDYINELKAEEDKIHARIAAKTSTKQSDEYVQVQWGSNLGGKLELAGKKIKPKTRGNSDIHPEPPPSLSKLTINTSPDHISPPPIQLTKRTFAIIRALFPSHLCQDRKPVDWDAFVNAMAEPPISFVARHTAGGSAVDFEPDERSAWFGKGKIVFHKPHPVQTLEPIVLVGMGKRMRKWFGWSAEMFELRKAQ